jgi:AbrB family looped-hinge helix DNA binding protein
MILSKIGKRGQITLPREIRSAWGVGEGDQVAFLQRGDDILVQPLKQTLRDVRGSVPAREVEDADAIRQQVKQAVAMKVAHGD